jgi:hypothetical protein
MNLYLWVLSRNNLVPCLARPSAATMQGGMTGVNKKPKKGGCCAFVETNLKDHDDLRTTSADWTKFLKR